MESLGNHELDQSVQNIERFDKFSNGINHKEVLHVKQVCGFMPINVATTMQTFILSDQLGTRSGGFGHM